jgi:DNA-binding response OmpR family regulator
VSRLLLIEDDADIRKLLERYLERAGIQVVSAGDGEEGLKIFFHDRFDIVLIDGLLPKKSGFEVVPALRAMPRGKDVGVIMMTAAFKTPKARKDAFDSGVDAFFTKPFVLHDLKAKIDELIARHPAATASASTASASSASSASSAPLPRTASSSNASRAVVPAEELRRTVTPRARPAIPVLPNEAVVKAPLDVARLLLQCARHRLSGTVQLADEASQLVIAFLKGVIVGATDNLREQLLGEMLWKQGRLTTEQMRDLNMRITEKGERVAEALLALGMTSPEETLALVEEQTKARVRRALLWTGKLKVVQDEDDAQKRAVDSVELLDVLLSFALEPAQTDEAQRFIAAHKGKALLRGPAFDDVLMALARTKPDAVLPGVLLAGDRSVTEAAAASSPSEVYAAHLAELVRLPDDPTADVRPLPTVLRSDVDAALIDRPLANKVCGLLLKARGRSAYALFDKPRTASDEEMMKHVEDLLGALGKEILVGGKLGPAQPAARELWAILEEYREIFSDPVRRALHDAVWGELPPPAPRVHGPEEAFLDGQLALTGGDIPKARACFEAALGMRAHDAEYKSWHAWSRILDGDAATGIKELMGAMREHPQSMRPMFFLGMHAARNGEKDKARALLLECARRSPHDVEVQAALGALD